jgi:hypothetical protein
MVSTDLMMVDNELEGIWKENLMAYLKVLSRHVPGRTEENHGKPRDILCADRVSNLTPLARRPDASPLQQEYGRSVRYKCDIKLGLCLHEGRHVASDAV